MSFPAMQLHSLPRSQPRIAGWSFISRTKWRTKRVCHVITSASSSTLFASKAGGTKRRPLIQPVMRPTTSFTSCFCETSHMKRKRRIISSSTPAGFWSGPSFCARPLSVPLVHAGRVLERAVVLREALVAAAAAQHARERLEVGPEREHAHDVHAVARELRDVLLDGLGVPPPPHVHAGVRRPVVAAGVEDLAGAQRIRRRGRSRGKEQCGEGRRKDAVHFSFPFQCACSSWFILM